MSAYGDPAMRGKISSKLVSMIRISFWFPVTSITIMSSLSSSPVLSIRFRIFFRNSWSVLIVNPVIFKYSRNWSKTSAITRYSLCAISYLRSALVSSLDQYSIGFTALSCCSCGRTQPTFTSRASVSTVSRPVQLRSARTGSDLGAFLSDCIDWSSPSFSVRNFNGRSFQNFLLNGAATLAKMRTKPLNTLHNTRNERGSVRFVKSLRPLVVSVVFDAMSKSLGRMTRES